MKLNIEIDIENITQYLDEETETMNEAIKADVIYKSVQQIVQKLDLTKVADEARKELRGKLDTAIAQSLETTTWLNENEISSKLSTQLLRMATPELYHKTADALKRDPEFIKMIAKEAFK